MVSINDAKGATKLDPDQRRMETGRSSLHQRCAGQWQGLKAPKGAKNNTFRELQRYRSCEDILEAVKPLLLQKRRGLTLILSDTIDAVNLIVTTFKQQRPSIRMVPTSSNGLRS